MVTINRGLFIFAGYIMGRKVKMVISIQISMIIPPG